MTETEFCWTLFKCTILGSISLDDSRSFSLKNANDLLDGNI